MNNRIRIPLARPSFDEREIEEIKRVLGKGWVVQGPEVEAFEAQIAELHKVRHCIAVSSGTAALHLSFLALDIGRGDVVFLPSFAWPSAANMAMRVGARPVFVDVHLDTYNIDSVDLRKQITRCLHEKWGTPKIIVPVHEFGLAAAINEIVGIAKEYGMAIIEDAACAFGATYKGRPVGTFGRLGILSFHPRKAVTTGEGGAIITSDDLLADRCRSLRNHGQMITKGIRDFAEAGFNYRLTDIQAAIGRVQVEKLPGMLEYRKKIVRLYLEHLKDVEGLKLPAWVDDHTWQTFMIVIESRPRDEIIAGLIDKGIESGPGSFAGHLTKYYREKLGYSPRDLPISHRLHLQGLALPLYHGLPIEQAIFVCATIRDLLK